MCLPLVVVVLAMVGKFGISGCFGSVFLWAPELFPTTLRYCGIGKFGRPRAPPRVARDFIPTSNGEFLQISTCTQMQPRV